MNFVSFLITLLVLGLVGGLVYALVNMLPTPPFPALVKQLVLGILILIAIIYLLGILFGGLHVPALLQVS